MADELLRIIEELSPADLTQRLLSIDTTCANGREREAAELLVHWAQSQGLETELQVLNEGQANAVVRLRGSGPGPTLLFCGHMDTVPAIPSEWRSDPFVGVIDDDRVYGRGASDMKSGLASMLVALAALKRSGAAYPGDIVFAAFAGEVVEWAGSRHFLANGGMENVAWMVVGEPTNLDLVTAHRGVLWLRLRVIGRIAHGSAPELGSNALTKAISIIHDLERSVLEAPAHPLLPPPTATVTMMNAGERPNFIASECAIVLDIRPVPGLDPEDVKRWLLDIAEHAGPNDGYRFEVETIVSQPPVETPVTAPLIIAAREAAQACGLTGAQVRGVGYFSDAAVLQPATGVPTLIFGPGDDRVGQHVDEYVKITSLSSSALFLCSLASRLFAAS